MHSISNKRMVLFCCNTCLCALISLTLGCAKKPPAEKVALRVNGYAMSVNEFNQLFTELQIADEMPNPRQVLLDNLINRKLLLQEAQRQGLDKEAGFLRSIEDFWEHSLLTLLIDKQMKKIASDVTPSAAEVEASYADWKSQNPDSPQTVEELRKLIEWQLSREKQAKALNAWIDSLRKNARINVDKKALGIE